MLDPLLLLASASPRRHEILNQLCIDHRVVQVPAPDGDDEPQLPDETPQDYVQRTAREKAYRAAAWLSQSAMKKVYEHREIYILCADTTVMLNQTILGKPHDLADAADTLQQLSGQTHEVHTAIALMHNYTLFEARSISTVRFKALSMSEIRQYCATGEPMDKAGAYAIQGRGAAFITELTGSYTGVMGLPAYETIVLLRQAGFVE